MIFLRSLIFNICFFLWAMLSAILFAPLFILSSNTAQKVGKPWALGALFLAKHICGITYEIRGCEHMLTKPVIYASKHQSAWDTTIFLTLLHHPAYVLKRELLRIPLWGWYLWRMQMIAIDRSAGASAMKHMLKQAKAVLANGRPIVIYPEGTRTRPGAAPHYHPGTTALYAFLGVPVVPVALNSGYFWGKDAFLKRPGKIILEFLPPIAPGMGKPEFAVALEKTIETASQKLLEEAK
jgi:1-acyl-sn-glycerol-3-phosphate acyltransferase